MVADASPPRKVDYTADALATMGLPESPVIDLSIRTVAELLQPLDARSRVDARSTCISRFRTASHAALEGLSIEWARYSFLISIGADSDGTEPAVAFRPGRTDWLGHAKAALDAIGVDTGPDAKRMATRYGWLPKPRA